MDNDLAELDRLMRMEDYVLFVHWDDDHPDIHLTTGMCDDFGCSPNCKDFKTLHEVLSYLKETHNG